MTQKTARMTTLQDLIAFVDDVQANLPDDVSPIEVYLQDGHETVWATLRPQMLTDGSEVLNIVVRLSN